MYWVDHIAEDRFSVWFGPDWVQDFDSLEEVREFLVKMREDG